MRDFFRVELAQARRCVVEAAQTPRDVYGFGQVKETPRIAGRAFKYEVVHVWKREAALNGHGTILDRGHYSPHPTFLADVEKIPFVVEALESSLYLTSRVFVLGWAPIVQNLHETAPAVPIYDLVADGMTISCGARLGFNTSAYT